MKKLTFEQMVQRLILWIKFITKNKTMRSMPVLDVSVIMMTSQLNVSPNLIGISFGLDS